MTFIFLIVGIILPAWNEGYKAGSLVTAVVAGAVVVVGLVVVVVIPGAIVVDNAVDVDSEVGDSVVDDWDWIESGNRDTADTLEVEWTSLNLIVTEWVVWLDFVATCCVEVGNAVPEKDRYGKFKYIWGL